MKERYAKTMLLAFAAFAALWFLFMFWMETQPTIVQARNRFAASIGVEPSTAKSIIHVSPPLLVQIIGPAALAIAFRRKELRLIRFSLLAVFITIGLVAAVFGIGRLSLPWPLKLGLIFALLICAFGLAARNVTYAGKT
jgi:hypothetical protein